MTVADSAKRVFVVEDESHICNLMIEYIASTPGLQCIGFANDGAVAIEKIREKRPDVVLLDLNLPNMSGIDILKHLEQDPIPPAIIVTTSYREYSLQALEHGIIDYLTKPFGLDRFQKAVRRVVERRTGLAREPVSEKNLRVIALRQNLDLHVVPHRDIVYLASHGRKTIVFTRNKEIEASMQLNVLLEKLPKNLFIRTHKQFAINVSFVSHLQYNFGGRYLLYLKTDEALTVPVGARYAPEVKIRFGL